METGQNIEKAKGYLRSKIRECDKKYKESTQINDKIHWASVRRGHAQILKNFLDDKTQFLQAQILQSETYLMGKCFDQAILQARLAFEYNRNMDNKIRQKLNYIIVKCMIEKQKFMDAKQILFSFQANGQDSTQKLKDQFSGEKTEEFYDLLFEIFINMDEQENLNKVIEKLEGLVIQKYGKQSIEYGMLLVKRGNAKGHFGNYEEAVRTMQQGMQIMIEKKWKNKEKISQIYFNIASFYFRNENWVGQYSSLICAQAMLKQIGQNQKEKIKVCHLLSQNLLKRNEQVKAINELKKAYGLQKQAFGQSSVHVGKTNKIITKLLLQINEVKEAKKYEQQYRRILGILGEQNEMLDC